MYLPYFGQNLESKKKVVGILAHVWLQQYKNDIARLLMIQWHNILTWQLAKENFFTPPITPIAPSKAGSVYSLEHPGANWGAAVIGSCTRLIAAAAVKGGGDGECTRHRWPSRVTGLTCPLWLSRTREQRLVIGNKWLQVNADETGVNCKILTARHCSVECS